MRKAKSSADVLPPTVSGHGPVSIRAAAMKCLGSEGAVKQQYLDELSIRRDLCYPVSHETIWLSRDIIDGASEGKYEAYHD